MKLLERTDQISLTILAVAFLLSFFLCGLHLGLAESIENQMLWQRSTGINIAGDGTSIYGELSLRYLLIFLCLVFAAVTFVARQATGLAVRSVLIVISILQACIGTYSKPATLSNTASKYRTTLEVLWYLDYGVLSLVGALFVLTLYSGWRLKSLAPNKVAHEDY